MATTKEYIAFVCEQIERYDDVRYRKMFGEYMAYLNEKPILLICDNTVFVRELTEVEPVMKAFNAECGFPYEGAKEHFVLDIEKRDLLDKLIPRAVPPPDVPDVLINAC